MAKPVIEKIADEVVARLQNISVANGYEFTVVSAEFVSRKTNTWTPEPLKIKVEYGSVTANDALSYPGNPPGKAYDVEFEISGYAKDIDRDESEVGIADPGVTDTQMIAAMMKAITNNDPANWHTFGSNAVIADIVSASTFDAAGFDGGMITLMVSYRTSEINPFA